MKKFTPVFLLLLIAALALGLTGVQKASAQTVELRMIFYKDGNEDVVLRELLDRFEKENAGIKVTIETVPFADLDTVLQTQLESANPPDMARITNLPRYVGRYLDMREYMVDAAAWEANFSASLLNQMRKLDGTDKGLYGFPSQFTVSGPIINATKFAEAGVEIPTGKTTFKEWVALASDVAKKTNTPYAVAIDRSFHRIMGPVLSLGGTYLDKATGKITFDTPAMREFLGMLLEWHKEGITPQNIWVAQGDKYASGRDFFVNGELVFYFSGSWQVGGFGKDIGDKFEWKVVPQPCGEGGCFGMPGGASFVAFKGTKYAKEVTRVMEYLSSEAILGEFSAKTSFLPGHLGLIKSGVKYEANQEALAAFSAMIPDLPEQGFLFQVSPLNGPLNVEMRTRVAQAIVGEITLDDAIKAVQKLADDTCAAEPAKCPAFK